MTSPLAILVVEDNPITRTMLRIALESEGYAAREAPDARTALAMAAESWPDLVLQGLILPDMDGLELLRHLRALPGGPELPIVALSGFLSRQEESPTGSAGFTALLVKPIQPSRLIEAIARYLPCTHVRPTLVGGGQRLLIVDDDPIQLKLSRVFFTHLGFQVTAARSAGAALAAARLARPDIILSDVFMPEVDGFQLCLELRRDPKLASVRVVLVSGQYGSEADQDLARSVGANALVARTPDFAHVLPAITAAVQAQPPAVQDEPNDQVKLQHARLVIHRLEERVAEVDALTRQCAFQSAQLSLLSGVADALTKRVNVELALRDVFAATLDAAGISKGALIIMDESGVLKVRHTIGFSEREVSQLPDFFGHAALLARIVDGTGSVSVPSHAVPELAAQDLLSGARVASMQIVPLISHGRGVGAMVIGATRTDVTSRESTGFARVMGKQIVQSLELAQAVARVTASEERYRTLLDNAHDAIAILTPDGVVCEMNQRWSAILGRPREDMMGLHLRDVVPVRDDDEQELAPTAEILRPDGTVALIAFSSTEIDIAGERLVFTVGRDVTEQRKLEHQLRQAQKLEAIGHLAGGVAHDFNNVLTAILGFAELLTEELPPDSPGRADLFEIKRAGERAAGLTRQLLAFSRRQILQPVVLDVNQRIRDLQLLLRRVISEDIDFHVTLAAALGQVRMDPTQFEQILVNLVVNAGDAMPRGGALTIETRNATLDDHYQQHHFPVRPGAYVLVAVSDTGIGMDQATRERIFEPFFTTKEVGKGTGLGLATVHGIVKQSGGDIWVYSEPRLGTTFKIYLPQVVQPAQAAAERAAATELARGTETVLLVEDDQAVRRLARVTLERAGYTVLQAGNPKEAMRVAAESGAGLDLLLSDVVMPESDGPLLFDRLTPLHPMLRVLYISGYADEAIVRHGILVDGTPFMQKPFTPHGLARKVREVLDGAG
jgi:PAS domain S-box-containing protein